MSERLVSITTARLWNHGCARRSFRPGVPVCIIQIDRNHITVFSLFCLRKNTILAAWLIALVFICKRKGITKFSFYAKHAEWCDLHLTSHIYFLDTHVFYTRSSRVYPGLYQCHQRFPKLSLNSINLVKKIQESQGWDRAIFCVAKQYLIPSTT